MAEVSCAVSICERRATRRGWCGAHYMRWKATGDVRAEIPLAARGVKVAAEDRKCSVVGCGRNVMSSGLCGTHHRRRTKYGDVMPGQPVRTYEGIGPCKVEGCTRWQTALGWCQRHYRPYANYRLTPEQFASLLESQGGRCAICETGTPGGPHGWWQVDHDHACCPGQRCCGKCVRGLLCGRCNSLLGYARDDPKRLRAAIQYLGQLV